MPEKKDRFEQNTTWITRLYLDKSFENYKPSLLCVLKTEDGFEIKSKMHPDKPHKELYQHAHILVDKEPVVRYVNSQDAVINKIKVTLLSNGTVIEYKSNSASKAQENYVIIKKELLQMGIGILKEVTKRCEKDNCKVS